MVNLLTMDWLLDRILLVPIAPKYQFVDDGLVDDRILLVPIACTY